MLASGILLLSALAAPSGVMGETVLGLAVFSRHGDRTSKHYSGYSLTNLGAQQNFQVGSDYRKTYLASSSPKRILGISADKYVPSQVYASAPDQMVLLNTATAFLQGLYPPLSSLDAAIASQTLNNGSSYSAPLEGYQYVVLHGESEDSSDTIWIKGDELCPAATTAQNAYKQSTEYKTLTTTTKSLYERMWPLLQGVYDYTQAKLNYSNAYDIFDLINVASIHNATTTNVTADDLFQLRTLADSAEFGTSYNATQPGRAIGGQTLLGAMLQQLNQTVTGKGKLKFSILAGSYDTFQAVFGLTNLTSLSPDFYGLPAYAGSIAFELFTSQNVTAFPSVSDIQVRFMFRNGSDASTPLTVYPLFGSGKTALSWTDFVSEMQTRAITTVEKWCGACASTQEFCQAYNKTSTPTVQESSSSSGQGLSNAVAGVIGAVVTLAVVGIAALAFFLVRRRKSKAVTPVPASAQDAGEKGSLSSGGRGSA